MIVPLLALTYVGIGIYRTQRGKIAQVIHPNVPAMGPAEPLWHVLAWPVGLLFVAGK